MNKYAIVESLMEDKDYIRQTVTFKAESYEIKSNGLLTLIGEHNNGNPMAIASWPPSEWFSIRVVSN